MNLSSELLNWIRCGLTLRLKLNFLTITNLLYAHDTEMYEIPGVLADS